MIVPAAKKELIATTQKEVVRIDEMYQNGLITEGERYNMIIDQWTATTEQVAAAMLEEMALSLGKTAGPYDDWFNEVTRPQFKR